MEELKELEEVLLTIHASASFVLKVAKIGAISDNVQIPRRGIDEVIIEKGNKPKLKNPNRSPQQGFCDYCSLS